MIEKSPVFVGFEILRTAGRLSQPFVYAAMDGDRKLLAIGHGDRDEVLAYLGGQHAALAAINASRRPNTGIVNNPNIHLDESPFEKPKSVLNARLCDYLLQQQGYEIDSIPAEANACPRWMQRGIDLYRRLEDFGYQPYPNEKGPRASLETWAEAVYWHLLAGTHPLPKSLEGRLQR